MIQNPMIVKSGGLSLPGWIQTTMPASAKWRSVTYGGGKFVAVTNGSIAAYSTDGVTWYQTTMPASAKWRSVTYGCGKFIAVVYNNNIATYIQDSYESWA